MHLSSRRALILIGLIAAGFTTGYLVRPAQSPPTTDADSSSENSTHPRPVAFQETPAPAQRSQPVSLDLRSTDTIEDLLAAPADELYARLALWLVDASSAEMHDFFRQFIDHPNATTRHFDLLFVRWAATDPMGAIQAAEGTPQAHIPWWGWAKNEPLAAFRHAMETDPSRVEWIIMSIGQNNPELAKSLLAQHPELPPNTGANGLIHGLTRDDPEAAMELTFASGGHHDTKPLQSWLRDDPHAAFEWFLKNRELYPNHYSHDDTVITSLARENPGVLAELAATTPPGALRRKLEDALFEKLAATDPAKALAEARANPSPMVVRDRLAKLGVLQLEKNPQAARAILEELLAVDPDPATSPFPPSPQATPEVFGLLTGMARQNPERTLTHILAASPDWNRSGEIVATRWAKDDPEALAAWALRHPDPKVQENCAPILIKQHSEANDFPKALSFLEQVPAENRTSTATRIVSQWRDHDPQAARTWVEDAGMMDSMNMKHVFKNR